MANKKIEKPPKLIAKLMPPKITGVLHRKRLFARLDNCREHPAVCISAPGGAGKTTLISSYLASEDVPFLWYQVDEGDSDPATFFYFLKLAVQRMAPRKRTRLPEFTLEHLANLGPFTRFFFRQLFDLLPQPLIIVLDNYQTVPEDALLHEIVAIAVGEVPAGCNLILLSRHQPPSVLTSLQINGKLGIIGADELRLNNEEARTIANLRNVHGISDSKSDHWNQLTDGWAAGLVLLLENARTEASQTAEIPMDDDVKEITFDYFGREIFRHMTMDMQKFLVTSAFLPIMTIADTQALTENTDAGKILAGLARKNYFTTRHRNRNVFYQYHPMFRDFLLETAGLELGQQDYRVIQQKTAELLEKGNDPEQSVGYFLQLADWQGFERVIKTIAQGLLEQGRNQTLLAWLGVVPGPVLDNYPWLKYWQGMGMQFIDTQAALAMLEQAYWGFKAAKESSGAYLAWSVLIFTGSMVEHGYYSALSAWGDEFRDLRHLFPEFESTRVETQAITAAYRVSVWGNTDSKEITLLEERLLALLNSDLPLTQRFEIGIHLIGKVYEVGGNRDSAILASDRLTPLISDKALQPSTLCMWIATETYFSSWLAINGEDYLSRLDDALTLTTANQLSTIKCLVLIPLIFQHLTDGHQENADRLLNEFAKKLDSKIGFILFYHRLLCAWYDWLANRPTKAMQHLQSAQQEIIHLEHFPLHPRMLLQIGLAQICASQGRYGEAIRHTALLRQIHPRQFNQRGYFLSWLANAQFALEKRQPRRSHAFLRRALAIAREQGFVRFPFFKPQAVAQLCSEALQANIEVDYVQSLIRQRRLAPPSESLNLDCWPWPLKIRCFGTFELIQDDAPIQFARKAPKKPLQLLKALVALGGQQVNEQRLIDRLWPDEEGDKAHNAYSTTLSRLRKLIGVESITLIEGALSLNTRHCWLDVWSFQGLLKAAEHAKQNDDWQDFEQSSQNALGLYRDHFLAAEADESWAIALRERLRHQYLDTTAALADGLQARGDWRLALNCYQSGLDVENLSEDFYQGLMRCYQQLGLKAEALESYHRCKRILSLSLGVEPSAATQKLYNVIANH
jgi:DNA-binding SARP family transcriptional activator